MAPKLISGPVRDLNHIEIFRAGTYTLSKADGTTEQVNYSESDVAEIAANTNSLISAGKHDPPKKLGHDDDQAFARMAGLPAIGWVKRVTAEGGRMFADFRQVPEAVIEAIQNGAYKHISSEIYNAAQTAANFGGFVKGLSLRAVALLGADVPVVKGMDPVMAFGEGGKYLTMTLEVTKMAEFGKKDPEAGSAMVHLNRHPVDASVKMKGGPAKAKIHAVNPDDTYDLHDTESGAVHKNVPHENLTLLSETYSEGANMKDAAALLAESEAKAAKLAEENAKLLAKAEDEKIAAFAEKHKGTVKQPAILAAFKALVKSKPGEAVKLAEGKEAMPFAEAFMAFAESLLKAKPVLFGELAPVGKEGEVVKDTVVKLAEEAFSEYRASHGMPGVSNAPLAVTARAKFAEHQEAGRKGPHTAYRAVLLAEAAKTMRYDLTQHRYVPIEQGVA